ncbi:MAG: ABC transporter substrate-binding protein [Chloroflexi bacterium]|nr:ABC transporter substrate-binding protein [Chloroflexota bacterium]
MKLINIRAVLLLSLLLVFSLLAAACGGDATATSVVVPTAEPTKAPTEAPAKLTEVSIALDWFPWSNHSGLYIAQERGYFTDEGLDVNIYVPGDPTTVLQTVGAGRDDFGISYQPELLIAREQGIEAVSIMALVQHPLNSIMALTESGIAEPKDLKGKKVGATGAASDEALIDTMLRSQGLTVDDVELVNVGFDLIPALISKNVDAIIGAYWVHESISATNLGFELNIMRMEDHGVPDFYELVIVASEDKIANEPEVIQRFVRAVTRGYQDAIADPLDAVALLKSVKPETDLDIENPGVLLLAPLWATDNGVFGWQEQDRWEDFANWMADSGRLSSGAGAAAAYDNSFVEAAR